MSIAFERFEALFRDAIDPILIEDLDGNILEANDEAVRLYGYTRDELVGQSMKMLIPIQWQSHGTRLRERCRAGEAIRNIRTERLPRGGPPTAVLLSLSLLKDDDGNVQAIATVARDIRQLRAIEKEARMLSSVFRDATDPIIIEDLDGVVIDMNHAAEKLYQWNRDELVGKSIKEIIPEASHAAADEMFERCKQGEIIRDVDGARLTKDGTIIPVLVTVSLVKGQDGDDDVVVSFAKNVSRLRTAENEARRLSAVFRDAADPIILEDLDGIVTDVNQAAENLYGWSREELLGKTIKVIIPEWGHEFADELLEQCRAGEEVRDIEGVRMTKEGNQIPVLVTVSLIMDDHNRPVGVASFAKEITAQKNAQAELTALAEKLEERVQERTESIQRANFLSDIALELTNCGYWQVDYSDPDYYYPSKRAVSILGEPIKEDGRYHLQDEWFARLIAADPEIAEATNERYQGALDGKYEHYAATYPYKSPIDGNVVWVHAVGKIVRDEDGNAAHMYGVYQDVTERIQAERRLSDAKERAEHAAEELQKSRVLTQGLLDATEAVIFVKGVDGRYMLVNHEWTNIVGRSIDDTVGKTDHDIMPREVADKLVENDRQVIESAKPIRFQETPDSDAEARTFISNKFPLFDSSGNVYAVGGVSTDITQLKEQEEALRLAREAADAANQAKSDFLANMSHEIRTPMNGIMGMTELALATELTAEQREFLTTIESSAESLLTLINDILDFSKIEAKKLDLDPINFELRERLGETLTTLAARAHSKGLELLFEVNNAVPEYVVGDLHRIRQIVINLVGNAVKFTEEGEIALAAHVVETRDDQVVVKFDVSDTGIGLSSSVRESIFRPFEQADASTTRKYGGTGLGLTICNQLVELMGGKMTVDSQLGIGTTFSFTVPFGIGESTGNLAPYQASTPDRLQGLRVLVVDDNDTNRRILAKMLENWGMRPVVVESADDGLKELEAAHKKDPIGLILSDVNMPEMDGFMFAEEVIQKYDLKKLPMILLTSANRTGDTVRCRELGISAHLIKPARQSLLFDAIASSVGVADEAQSERVVVQEASAKPSEMLRGLKVLLAEDNETNQKFAIRALQKADHDVTVANNGQEAVLHWESEAYDVVLMDIQMPVMDGYAATAAIRSGDSSKGLHTPVIAMTAHAMKGDQQKCLDAGMDGYVTKPIKSKVMHAEIARVLHELDHPSARSDANENR